MKAALMTGHGDNEVVAVTAAVCRWLRCMMAAQIKIRPKTTRSEAVCCCWESESIDSLFFDHPGTPIAWFPVVRCDCQHQDFIATV